MLFDNSIIREDMEDIFRRELNWSVLNGKTILITGAYGMLASYIVYFLCYLKEKKNINVHIIAQCRNPKKAEDRFRDFLNKEYFKIITANLLKPLDMDESINYIIHAAGGANARLYATNPVEVIEPNVIGTYHLLQLAMSNPVEGLLYFSSGDIYGQLENLEYVTEESIGKIDPLNEHSCYGESKRIAETMCKAFWTEYKVPVMIARISHTYGLTMDIENDPRVFATFMRNAIWGEDIVMLSDGSAKRPFCYLADAVAAYFYILFKGKPGEAYNVCNSEEFLSIREFAEIAARLNEKQSLKVICKARAQTDTYLESPVRMDINTSNQKLKELGMEFHFTTLQGMRKVYQYIRKNIRKG